MWVWLACWAAACVGLVGCMRDWIERWAAAHGLAALSLFSSSLPPLLLPLELHSLSTRSDATDAPSLHFPPSSYAPSDLAREISMALLLIASPFALAISHPALSNTSTFRRIILGLLATACSASACLVVTAGCYAAIQYTTPSPHLQPTLLLLLLGIAMVGGMATCCLGAWGVAQMPAELAAPLMRRELEHIAQMNASLAVTQEELRSFHSSFDLRGQKTNLQDRSRLEHLLEKERQLKMKVLRAQQTYCTRGLRIRELLMRLASVSLFLLFLVYFLSLLMSLVSQARLICGVLCFEAAVKRDPLLTPLDRLLLLCAELFPLDLAIIAVLMLLLFGGCATSFRNMYPHSGLISATTIRLRGSPVRSILAFASSVSLAALSFTGQLVLAAPQYATYGLQSHARVGHGDRGSCSEEYAWPPAAQPTDRVMGAAVFTPAFLDLNHSIQHTETDTDCGVSNSAILLSRFERQVPYFFQAWYLSNCVCVMVYFVGTTFCVTRHHGTSSSLSKGISGCAAVPLGSAPSSRDNISERTPLANGCYSFISYNDKRNIQDRDSAVQSDAASPALC